MLAVEKCSPRWQTPPMPQETELKLSLLPADRPRLLA
ncbi:MAG: hypothetical protein ACI83N_002036, partial [Hydrogenophaga sp.]